MELQITVRIDVTLKVVVAHLAILAFPKKHYVFGSPITKMPVI
ncbi:hypothetical protein VME0621_01919 [Vibrio mediterranei]|nr:hypothetical protein VME0621_01919 [Vibrio mediterranei]